MFSPADGAGTVDITVTTAGGTSATGAGDHFTYLSPPPPPPAAPTVTGVSPASGSTAGGTVVDITGADLGGATAVDFGGLPADVVADTATEIVVFSPADAAGTVDVTVTTAAGISATTAADQFTNLSPPTAAPTVTGVGPASGSTAGDTTVDITGTNLDGAAAVDFGGAAATIVSDTGTQIVVLSPAGTAGVVDVTVTTAAGTSATSAADQFTYAAAVVPPIVPPTSPPPPVVPPTSPPPSPPVVPPVSSPPAVPPVSPPPPAVPPTPKTALVGYPEFAVGADAGGTGTVSVYNADGSVANIATPFGASYTAGVRVAVADLNNDGSPELIAGTGPGVENQVVILDGTTHQQLASFEPFEATFTDGVFVTTGDVNGDGVPDLIVTPDQSGGPIVAVYDGAALGRGQVVQLARFFGINDPNFRGGDRAALGDINGDGVADLIVSAGFGGGPRVAIYNGATIASGAPTELMPDFFAFESSLRNGVYVTAGDLTGKGYADLIFGAGPGGAPRVRAVDPAVLLSAAGNFQSLDDPAVSGAGLADFFSGDPTTRGGARVAVANLDGDAKADVIVGSGTGTASTVTAYTGAAIAANPTDPAADLNFDALPGFTGGVFVG
ncbi:Flagellar hook-length control protein FliK [Fimbriiglobus ruber]|uniref:Flagellar hook-length control protein FliK n=1 Tax=Fimbriiglobus ruber TaxID=1908690 RepID=A0A225D6P1_9BACT|nr:Flagellar hook-length control protein FliK [Fimbriiglobus ruber]